MEGETYVVVYPPVRVLSLFSGIGGLDLGVHAGLAHLGYTAVPVCYVEREAFAVGVLAARMEDGSLPAAPVWSDVTTFDGRELAGRVDLVVGGFPCQDISNAGRRAGILPGNRSGLWFEFLRVIRVVRPRYVFVENVAALLGRGLDIVLGTLAEVGFDAEWTTVRASDTGAPHQRERVFILAVADTDRSDRQRADDGCANAGADGRNNTGRRGRTPLADTRDRLISVAGRRAEGRDDVAHTQCGEGGERQQPNRVGRRAEEAEQVRVGGSTGVADTVSECGGRRQPDQERKAEGRVIADGSGPCLVHAPGVERDEAKRGQPHGGRLDASGTSLPLYPPGPGDDTAWAAVLRQWPDLAPALSINEEWDYGLTYPLAKPPPESALRQLADGPAAGVGRTGASTRAGQLRALGNGVVPAAAAVAFVTLWERIHGQE